MNLPHDLILASKSPRRQEILRQLGLDFRVETLEIDESFDKATPAAEVAELLAIRKNKVYREKFANEIIITADTTVVHNEKILNKPLNQSDAMEMLKSLSGEQHQVITGVAISVPARTQLIHFSEKTLVSFQVIDEKEIRHYINEYQPFDKAGAYGIQEWIGMIAIERIEGSYQNVVGLPSHRIYQELKKIT